MFHRSENNFRVASRIAAPRTSSAAFDNEWLGLKPPVLFLLRNCRQLSADHWQGTRPDGALFDIRGGAMPPKQRLLVFNNDERLVGLIRLIPAIKQQTNKHNRRGATSTSGR